MYLAEQEEPVRRQVALKLIKLGMDTRAMVSRFEAERQALALMDHPGIASLGDGLGSRPSLIASRPNPNGFVTMAISPDGHHLALADVAGTLELRELPSGQELGRWPIPNRTKELKFHPDGDRFFSVHRAEAPGMAPGGNVSTPAAEEVFEVGRDPDGSWRCLPPRRLLATLTCVVLQGAVYAVVVDPSTAREFDFINVSTGERVSGLPRRGGTWQQRLAYSPDGTRLATVSKQSVLRVWDPERRLLIWEGNCPGWILGQAVAFSRDGKLIAASDRASPSVMLWEAASGRFLRTLTNSARAVWSVGFGGDPDGGEILVAAGESYPKSGHGVSRWRIRSTRAVLDGAAGAMEPLPSSLPASVIGLITGPLGGSMALVHDAYAPGASASIVDVPGLRDALVLRGLCSSPENVAFTPDGGSVVALTAHDRVIVVDAMKGTELRSFDVPGPKDRDGKIALSPSGKWLAASCPSTRRVDIYEFATGKRCYVLPGSEAIAFWMGWHPTRPRLPSRRMTAT